MPQPPKLMTLKQWLAVPDAARYLSALFNETVNDSDVLRLALDGHLKLSVRFLGTVYGQLASSTDSEIEPLEPNGIFDLPMTGAERLTVEEAYQREVGGPAPFFGSTDGTFVVDDWLTRYRLFASGPQRLSGLPAHSMLVLRRDALDQFLRTVASPEPAPDAPDAPQSERPVGTRERATLYWVIAAICSLEKLEIGEYSKLPAAIESETDRLGHRVAMRTVQHHLSQVRHLFQRK